MCLPSTPLHGAEAPLALAASDAVLYDCTCACRAPLCMVIMCTVLTSAPDAFFTMTAGSVTLEKTTVPSTQTTVFDTGTGAAASLATRFASLKEKSELQIQAVKDGVLEAKGLACPIMAMYTAVAPDSVGGAGAAGAWSKCMVCQVIVKGGFPKTGGGAGYPKETWPTCEFFSKPYKNMMGGHRHY